ncbi:Uncharacterized protein APZ42_006883 [Daphnia magna]|uniref:RNase H type-1 domain-containing protein n=1 Tax=Daphnia magna TaxID=35525 RepID=A0A164FN49_9CRUS|nr:Uncharacterized protein APZ42_006883 [Daphnia magna]
MGARVSSGQIILTNILACPQNPDQPTTLHPRKAHPIDQRNKIPWLELQPETHMDYPYKRSYYGIIAYGGASSTNIAKIDIVSRGILRLIFVAFKSTPVEILYADLGLEPRDSCPGPTSFQSPSRLHRAKKNTPAVVNPPPHSTSYFAMTKSAATQNETKARALFNSFAHQLPQSTIKAFSDGSVTSVTSCAYTIPDKKTEGAWFLTPGSNIQTAKLYGILKTLEACYHLEPGPPELYIFIDSHHVGILGNEQADKLANNQSNIPATYRIDNSLSAPEIIQKYRRK